MPLMRGVKFGASGSKLLLRSADSKLPPSAISQATVSVWSPLVLDPEGDKKKRQIVRELRQLCNEELPEYVQPVGYKFISEMPFTPVGKVDYRKLEEEITPRDY